MNLQIDVTDFNQIDNAMPIPLYVIVCGGIAVGKSHVVRRHFNSDRFVIADVDDYMTRQGFTDYDRQGVQFTLCMDQINTDIQRWKTERRSLISMGTGAHLDFFRFRLEEARRDRYRTAILHVKTDSTEQALRQNEMRRQRGEHAVGPEELHRIAETIERSADSVERIVREHPDLVDFVCLHWNRSYE
jgi:hypothetical protein